MRSYRLIIFTLLLIFSGIIPAFGQSCSELPAIVEHHSIYAESLFGDLKFDVYMPPCIDARILGGYPVLYLLHGQDMGIEIWQEMRIEYAMRNSLENESMPQFLTVVPQEDQYLLSFSLSGFEDAILETLIPWVDSHYNTCPTRNCRGIAGLSRGALWAEKIAFENPGLFSSVGLLSMPGTFIDDQSLYYIAEHHRENDEMLRIRMDTGSEDNYRHDGANAASQLTFIGYPYEYNIQPGGHNTEYWGAMLEEYFVWFGKGWKAAGDYLTITQTAE